jgi:predicted solute-binding protein
MTDRVRLGAVDYLNVRPLVYGLDAHTTRLSLRFDVPSVCARLLAGGDIDLGMVPTIAYLDRPDDRIVPGVCIGSDGPVASVALFTQQPIDRVRTIALDASSRTSVMLTHILCRRRFEIAPALVTQPPDLDAMLSAADAALLIGDPALFVDARARGVEKIDLGEEWTAMTGLPFVWAFWSGPDLVKTAAIVPLLQQTAETGMTHTDDIARAYCGGDAARTALARSYLRENLMFRLTDRALEGLRTFYRDAMALGLASGRADLKFFPAEGKRR